MELLNILGQAVDKDNKVIPELWVLKQEYKFKDYLGNSHIVPRGFITDLQSTPWFGEWIAPQQNKKTDDGALRHDWLYWVQSISRKSADNEFRNSLEQVSSNLMWRLRVASRYNLLRFYGWKAWNDNDELKRKHGFDCKIFKQNQNNIFGIYEIL